MVFGEDYCRKRQENAAENFNLIRKMAFNFIRSTRAIRESLGEDDYLPVGIPSTSKKLCKLDVVALFLN
jgi:hypothetical protein